MLGGVLPIGGKDDLNDYTETSVSILYNTQQANKPTDVTGGILLTFVLTGSMAFQILANNSGGLFYYRLKWAGTWQPWAKLSANTVTQ